MNLLCDTMFLEVVTTHLLRIAVEGLNNGKEAN